MTERRTQAEPSPGTVVSWQEALRRAVRDPGELCRRLDLPDEYEPAARRAAAQFGLFAPLEYVGRMRRGDPGDPLLRQVLPLEAECGEVAGFSRDPLGEREAGPVPGILQKYDRRALMVTTGACAVHCRYCFRRQFPYGDGPTSLDQWDEALAHLERDTSLTEVILSGGDPLTLVDATLEPLVRRLAEIGHLKRMRLHTRLPVVIPQRVTERLVGWLTGTRLVPVVVVVHANHPAELDNAVGAALGRLHAAGVLLLNQAVLLRGVNDTLEAQQALCERLVDLRVTPYYLHQLDRVEGAAHFEVPEEEGRRIMEGLRASLPGYAVPRYVKEVPGAASKVELF